MEIRKYFQYLCLLASCSVQGTSKFIFSNKLKITGPKEFSNDAWKGIINNKLTSINAKEAKCDCGTSLLDQARILGGAEAQPGEFPWNVYVEVRYRNTTDTIEYIWECAGTIIHASWILTAASCFVEREMDVLGIRVYAGNLVRAEGQMYHVVELLWGNYNQDSKLNDIAILRVHEPFAFGKNVQPACLPYPYRENYQRRGKVWTSGWGATFENGPRPYGMLKVQLDLLGNDQCNYYGMTVQRGQVCTYMEGKDTCEGDFGGSINYKGDNGRYYVFGITSYGRGCGNKDIPRIYTRASEYLDQIEAATGAKFCEP